METAALSFARPEWLNALWLLPLVVALFWWAERRRRALLGRIVAPKLRALLAGNTSPARRLFRSACVLLALALLVAAVAGPQLGYDTLEVPHRGRDVIIALDVSRSMLAPDVSPSRLERAKLLTEDLIDALPADRVGLIAFAGSAFLQAPLTLDHGAVLAALDELDTTVIPKGGTNIAAAIRDAEDAFGKAEGFSRALVIITDGEELDADGIAAAKQATAAGIRIFTVGVGSTEGSEIPLGEGDFVRDPAGKVVVSKLDASRLQEIATAGGGFYTPLNDDAPRLLAVDGIAKLSEKDFNANSSRRPIERYQWPLGAAIALLVLQSLVGERRRRLPAGLAAALFVVSATTGRSAPAGIEAYEAQHYEEARKAFEDRLSLEPGAPGLQLNAGAAAYRLKDYGKASEYFSRAMLSEDPALRSAAEFNLANTLFRQGEGQQDKEKKITDWKDAIAKYDAALKTRPDYREAKENKERVEELLKQLEQEQQQQQQDQKKDPQQKDQKKKDQQQQGGGQKDQQKQQGGDKDQQQQGQKDKDQQQQGGGQQKQDQQQSGGDQKDQQQQGGGGQEKKDEGQQGDKKDQQQGGGKDQKDEQGSGGDKKDEQGSKGDQQDQQGSKGEQQDQQQGGERKDDQQGDGGQEKKDQPGPGGEKQGEEKSAGQQEGKDQEGGREGGEPRESGMAQDGRPQPGQPGDKPAPVPTPGEKKEGEVRGTAGEQGKEGEPGEAAVAEAAEEKEGEMSEGQARALIRALQGEEEKVRLLERRNLQDVLKDW